MQMNWRKARQTGSGLVALKRAVAHWQQDEIAVAVFDWRYGLEQAKKRRRRRSTVRHGTLLLRRTMAKWCREGELNAVRSMRAQWSADSAAAVRWAMEQEAAEVALANSGKQTKSGMLALRRVLAHWQRDCTAMALFDWRYRMDRLCAQARKEDLREKTRCEVGTRQSNRSTQAG